MKYSIKDYSNFIDFGQVNCKENFPAGVAGKKVNKTGYCYYGLFYYVPHIHRIKAF